MIEKMKVVHIVASEKNKERLLRRLCDLGLLHLSEKADCDISRTERFNDLSRLLLLLQERRAEQSAELLSDGDFEKLYSELTDALKRSERSEEKRTELTGEINRLLPWGDFSLDDLELLSQRGIALTLCRVDKKTLSALKKDENVRFFTLAPVDGMTTIAVMGEPPQGYSLNEFNLPEKSLSRLQAELDECNAEIARCSAVADNAARYLDSFRAQLLKAQNDAEYSAAGNTVTADGGLVWLKGYIPAEQIDCFKTAAAENGWAWAIDDPAPDDENVPTKVKYNRITRLMIPVFDILGTVPGYREYDISFWFLGFFTLFFAMIIGDAGYGLIFLLAAVLLTVRNKKTDDITMLLWVLSAATVVWGALTGTWFGLEGAMKIPLLRRLVIPTFANYPEYFGVAATEQQNSIMKFCFILGTVQLSLACVMNIRRKLRERDLSFIADIGWLCAIDALYFVVLYLVIGMRVNLLPIAVIVAAGFLLVVTFGGMSPDRSFGQGLKAGLGDAFTVFLNTISAFGNIMSYIRLFAVGMASLAIAQSFNDMAAGFSGALAPAGALIMIVGHALNIVMGLLSVVVHGVRLNLLEFSGQLGMEWAGTAYDPFRKRDKLKK